MTGPPAWIAAVVEGARRLDAWTLSRRQPAPPESACPSAVLMLLGEGPHGPDVVLIERAHDMRSHAGQVAFPGGAADPGDEGPAGTALREAQEEIGLDPSGVDVLAVLPALWLPPSNFAVTPVLAWWRDESPIAAVDAAEVASVVRAPLDELVDPARRFTVRHPSGYAGPAFDLGDGLVLWGFTANVVDGVLAGAGLERPWDRSRVEPAPLPGLAPDPSTNTGHDAGAETGTDTGTGGAEAMAAHPDRR